MGKEVEGEGNQRHGRVVDGGSRESERVAVMGAQLGGHGCACSNGVDREQRGSGEPSEGRQGSSASSHRERGRGGGHANKHEGHAAAASCARSAELQFEIS